MGKKDMAVAQDIRLDIGCGTNKQAGFVGLDIKAFPGVDVVADARKRLPYADNSVAEIYSSHFVEHLTGPERVPFFNEVYRVLKPLGTARIITPEFSHARAYGDPTHQWPPMSSWYPLYLNKGWRDVNAPHVGYTCDFDYVLAVAWDQWLNARADKEFALSRYTNTVTDLIVTFTKRAG